MDIFWNHTFYRIMKSRVKGFNDRVGLSDDLCINFAVLHSTTRQVMRHIMENGQYCRARN